MKLATVELSETNRFSDLFLDYLNGSERLKEFYKRYPEIASFKEQIADKKFSAENRKILCSTLSDQYQGISSKKAVNTSLQKLASEKTFTITTGHQLNIFTGPLYFIYKIVSVIKTCKQLKSEYPEYDFVPVYWMASEDHDYDEIKYFWLNNKKYVWETEQSGAVGEFEVSGLKELSKSIPGIPEFFKEAYSKGKTLAEAVRWYVHELFGDEGLVVIDGNSKKLKSLFTDIVKDDLINHSAGKLVADTSAKIDELGYKTQIYARDINLFYLDKGVRERIEKNDARDYHVLNTDLSFSEEEILKIIDETPEKFSPNVVLRPLYQEVVLPNLAYIGGPAEVVYWFQLKDMFDHYKTSFPILMPRNFAAILPNHINEKVGKTGLNYADLFKPKHELHKQVTLSNTSEKVLLNGQKDELMNLFNKIKEQAASIDQTLVDHVDAQSTIAKSKLDTIEKKFIRAEKRKQSEKIAQIDSILEVLFTNDSLQERRDNFLNFYLLNSQFVEQLIAEFEPFEFKFYILSNGQ
ncbi:bacillithiol biosynthesis cysteine-adding enzyme BshC [Fulvivirga lutea]|uniref:Putative cysteine ligase BshC n=1 Tax=Fulvivirga lutea TaxID=2810512 RepID=A0A974WG82_9BACT|nr:bacillithiol biosynthesis cysteine-adding enzyme BshC [Fulvivirga lutea]QSE97903.1 bacillithiol biosynthesis cysteine-adding enzyme BshC [Fulvivirga lutea]